MAWDRVSVKQHFGGKITVNVGDRGNQVRKTLGFLPLDLLSGLPNETVSFWVAC